MISTIIFIIGVVLWAVVGILMYKGMREGDALPWTLGWLLYACIVLYYVCRLGVMVVG